MNLLNALSSEESIGGLEIGDDAIRFVLLKRSRTGLEATTLIEEKLSEKENPLSGVLFADKLNKFAKKNKVSYIIVSIASADIFVKTYAFPAAMPDDKIEESMKLTVDLQLPQKKEEIYCDWMPTEINDAEKKILLSYITKSKIDNLLKAIKRSGLKVLAVESRAMSLARIIKQKKDEALLMVEQTTTDYAFSVIVNNNVLFSQSAPIDKIGNDFDKEIRKIINYYGWFNLNLKYFILIGNFPEAKIKKIPLKPLIVETIEVIGKLPKDAKWLIPTGTAWRGLIPRKKDEIISLMAIGTELAFKREKANATVNFFIGISIALSIFFFGAFFATWSLISSIQNNYARQISAFNLLPSNENTNTLQDKAASFNGLVGQASLLVSKEAHWSDVVEEIKNKTVDGIFINNLSLPINTGVLSITGTANNREAINNLKKSFESSKIFTNVSLPLDNLGKKADIPFSLTFKISSDYLAYDN